MGVIKFVGGGMIRLWGCGGNAPTVWYEGILGMTIRTPYKYVRTPYIAARGRTVPYASVRGGSMVFFSYIYIYILSM